MARQCPGSVPAAAATTPPTRCPACCCLASFAEPHILISLCSVQRQQRPHRHAAQPCCLLLSLILCSVLFHLSLCSGSNDPTDTLPSLHAAPVTAMRYNEAADTVISCDGKGVIEYWSAVSCCCVLGPFLLSCFEHGSHRSRASYSTGQQRERLIGVLYHVSFLRPLAQGGHGQGSVWALLCP